MSHPLLAPRVRALRPLGLLFALVLLGGCDDTSGDEIDTRSLFAVVVDSEDLELLEQTVEATPLEALLQGSAEYTFFAPTNFALERLGPDLLQQLQSPGNRDVLLKILRRHLVPGRLLAADLRDGQTLTPLEGPPLDIRVVEDRIFVSGVPITVRRADFETGNGVVHYVDDVARDHLTLSERLRVTPLATRFAGALDGAELTSLFDGTPYTVLIPIDNAFPLFGGEELLELNRFVNRDILLKVLRHHILPGHVTLGDEALISLEGSELDVRTEDGVTYVGESRVIARAETEDGAFYLVDRILTSHLDLAERLRITPDRTLFREILEAAGLFESLRTAEALTVFAPSDTEIERLGPPFLDALRARPDLLLRTAQYGLIPDRVSYDDLFAVPSLTTLGGYELEVSLQADTGGPTAVIVGRRSRVIPDPVVARNGLLYELSTYLLPPDMNLEERAVFASLYRFIDFVYETGRADLFEAEGPYTIFAPTDAALLGQTPPSSSAEEILLYHFAVGSYDLDALLQLAPGPIPTLQGASLLISEDPRFGLVIGDDSIGVAPPLNARATNGIIFGLDGVLRLPQP